MIVAARRTLGAIFLPPVLAAEPVVEIPVDREVDRLRSCMIAIGVAYGVGLFSLSRSYACSTYLMLGMLCSMHAIVAAKNPGALARLSGRTVALLIGASTGWLAFLYVFVKLVVKAGGH